MFMVSFQLHELRGAVTLGQQNRWKGEAAHLVLGVLP